VGVVLYGGAFDPPHLGHVAVADAARERFRVERLVVLVSGHPAHRSVHAPAADRLALAQAAFPGDDVRLDPYPRTVALLRAEDYDDPVFVVGADQFAHFREWTAPDEILHRARLAVATRPGFPSEQPEPWLAEAVYSKRVVFFEIEPNPASSTDIRERVAAGEPIDRLVPAAVARLVEERELYRP
jgi:nicotinate-nucleotide adenylyltransferase